MAVFMCNNWTPPVTTPPVEPTPTYLTFSSNSSFTLKVYDNTKHWDGTLYYSTNTTDWIVWSGVTTLSSFNNKLYLRGTGNTKITGSAASRFRWELTGTAIECIGNIENLLDWETVALGNHPAMAKSCFAFLFAGAPLIAPPSLPAISVTELCYAYMFSGIRSLNIVNILPATTMASYCYSQMYESSPSIKVSTTKTGIYQYEWRMPTSGTGTTYTGWSFAMVYKTGGTFKGDPVINVTYYVENPPV